LSGQKARHEQFGLCNLYRRSAGFGCDAGGLLEPFTDAIELDFSSRFLPPQTFALVMGDSMIEDLITEGM